MVARNRIMRSCKMCGVLFEVTPSSNVVLCGSVCRRLLRRAQMVGNTFRVGEPANSGSFKKGVRTSRVTEFSKGQRPINHCSVGTVRIRCRKRRRDTRAFVKVAEPNKWVERAKLVWITHNGVIPKGLIVHHKSRDTLDDDIDNLELLTRAEHLLEHRADFEEKRVAALRISRRSL